MKGLTPAERALLSWTCGPVGSRASGELEQSAVRRLARQGRITLAAVGPVDWLALPTTLGQLALRVCPIDEAANG